MIFVSVLIMMKFVVLFYCRPAAAAIDDKWFEPPFVEEDDKELLIHNDDRRHLTINIELSKVASGRTMSFVGGASFLSSPFSAPRNNN